MEFDALMLDLDGVLIDSEDAWWQVLNSTLGHYKKESVSREFYAEHHTGTHPEEDIRMHFPEFSDAQIKVALRYYEKEFENKIQYIKLYPHVPEILEYFKNLNKKIGLVTSMRRTVLDKILEYSSLGKYFDTTVSGDNIRPKPYPDPILKACNELGVNPGNSVLVEDSRAGVKAGKAAGCYVIGITNTTTEEKLREAGADRILHSLIELKDIAKN